MKEVKIWINEQIDHDKSYVKNYTEKIKEHLEDVETWEKQRKDCKKRIETYEKVLVKLK